MKSKISFFNNGIFKSMLRRFWPLWAAHFAVWALMLPIPTMISTLASHEHTDSIIYLIQELGSWAYVLIAFFGAIIVAMAMFSFLYNNRSTGLIASLPVRREAVFCSAYLAGLLPIVASNLVVALLTFLFALGSGVKTAAIFKLVSCWFGMYTLDFVIFYGIAVIIAMMTGNIIALPVLYGIFNFLAIGMEQVVRIIISQFVYGMGGYDTGSSLEFLSPAAYLISRQNIWVQMSETQIDPETRLFVIKSIGSQPWGALAAYAVVAIAFSVIALAMFRRRRMENAGDVIAVPCLRPVFKYGVTACAALCGGLFLYVLFSAIIDSRAAASFVMIPSMVAGAFIGYFASEMLLKKSFHVFKGKWSGFVIVCCLCAVFTLSCDIDVLNLAGRLPDADEVMSINIDYCEVNDEAAIEKLLDINRQIVERKDEFKDADPAYYAYFRYLLKDGKTIERGYYINDIDLYNEYVAVRNDVNVLLDMFTPNVEVNEKNVYTAFVECYYPDGRVDNIAEMTPEQAVDFYFNALIPDIKAGNKIIHNGDETPCYVTIDFSSYDSNTGVEAFDSLYIQISSDCVLCAQWLKDNLGVDIAELEAACSAQDAAYVAENS